MAVTSNTMTGINGTKKDFPFTFPYLKTSDLKIELFHSTGGRKELDSTKFSMANATTISLSAIDSATDWQETTGAPKTGVTGSVYRATSSDSLVATFYPGSAIRSSDLNDNYTQNLYVTQEAENDSTESLDNSRVLESGAYVSSITKATNAVATANTADTNATTAVNTANTASTNATNAVNTANTANTTAGNAVTTANAATTTANSAVTTANAANTTAGNADTKADTAITDSASAVTTANTASTNATNAVNTANTANTTANTASTNASNAVTTANTARDNSVKQDGVTPPGGANAAITIAEDAYDNAVKQDGVTPSGGSNAAITIAEAADAIADEAKLATDRLVATTSDGGSTWTLAGNNTNASTDPKGVGYAVTQAEAAVTTANSAAATVAASAIYQVVANFAALPSLNSVDNDKFYQVSDSTNIEDESTVSGEPAGFTGDDELAVKLKSDTVSNPKVWVWQEYYATDPETRYRKKLIVENLTTISEDYTIGTGNNGFSIGPVTVSANKTITIPANSKYVVMN